VALLGSKARGKSVSIAADLAPDLPMVRALGGELNQVWINLIDNALDAAPVSGHVSVKAARERDQVVVRVTDDGPGIPPDIQSRVFEPFFTTKEIGHGTGIGLEIARKIIHRHSGVIDFETAPGRTQFRVALPVTPTPTPTPT
jgi:signal transduction histidine kinase